jgi:uncharacterized integral membrane protein
MSAWRWFQLVSVLLIGLVGTLFTVQNSSRTSDLSLDLWFAAWHLQAPAPLPVLLWVAFAVGLLVGVVGMAFGRRSGRSESPYGGGSPSWAPPPPPAPAAGGGSSRKDDDWT